MIIFSNSLVFGQIETSNNFGTVRIDSEIYEIKSGEKINVKISGNINDVLGGARITLVITEPNELTTGLQLTPTNKGYFETFWILDDNSPRGKYQVLATYHTYTIGSVFFSLEDKVFSEEELLEARGISEEEQIEEAEPTITLTEKNKELIDSFHNKANNYFENENYDTAITYYNRILEIDEQDLDALNRLGKSYFFLDDLNKALPYFEKALSIDPNYYNAYYNIGLIYDVKGQIDTALTYYDQAIEKAEDPHGFMVGKGTALYFAGRYTDAIKELDIVLEDEPNNLDALSSKSLALSSRDGKNDQFDALLALNKILEIDPDYSDAVYNKKFVLNQIGQDYDIQHDFDEAISYYDKILEVDPNYLDALHNKANALYQMDDFENSLVYYDRALEIKPNFPTSLAGKGTILNEFEQYNEAIKLFDKALAIDPNEPTAIQNKQFSLSKLNEIQLEQEQNKNQTYVIIGGIVAAGGILAVIVSKKLKSKKASSQEEIIKTKSQPKSDEKWEGI